MDDTREEWRTYLKRHLDRYDGNVAALSNAAGIQRSIVSRWVNEGTQPSVENARKLADALQVPVLQVLVRAGLLTEREVKQRAAGPADAGALSDEELIGELQRRLVTASGGGKVRTLRPVSRAAYPKDMDK